jgi:hypothetical protein
VSGRVGQRTIGAVFWVAATSIALPTFRRFAGDGQARQLIRSTLFNASP